MSSCNICGSLLGSISPNCTLKYSFVFLLDVISQLIWEPNGHYLVSAGGEDRYIRLWHNVPGMREQIKDNEEKLRKASSEPLKVCSLTKH